MQPADMIYQPANMRPLLCSFCLCVPPLCLHASLILSSTFLSFISPVTSAPSPLFIIPFPISLIYLNILYSCFHPLCSGECPVAVSAPSEARLPVAAGGGRRAWEHHNLWRWRRRWGWHSCLWHRCAPECSAQFALTWISHARQQEHVSWQMGV